MEKTTKLLHLNIIQGLTCPKSAECDEKQIFPTCNKTRQEPKERPTPHQTNHTAKRARRVPNTSRTYLHRIGPSFHRERVRPRQPRQGERYNLHVVGGRARVRCSGETDDEKKRKVERGAQGLSMWHRRPLAAWSSPNSGNAPSTHLPCYKRGQ